MKQAYTSIDFKPATMSFIAQLDAIIEEYQAQDFRLTVRQLYYQLVARGLIPNNIQEYKRTAAIINDAKMAGYLDWEAIEDRTREFVRRTRWESAPQILQACVDSYHQDMWANQDFRVFVIIEKEALVGVLEGVCRKFDVPLLAARGYPSGTVLREFAVSDLQAAADAGQQAIILHLGDHDPSGIDMTRDLRDRIETFSEGPSTDLHRIALTMSQVEAERPPENPAKTTDSRFSSYLAKYGTSSWELDALNPQYLASLVEGHIARYINDVAWEQTEAEVKGVQEKLARIAAQWGEIE